MRARSILALVVVAVALVGVLLPPTAVAVAPSAGPVPAARVGWINISATGSYGYTPPYVEQVPTNATITVTFTDRSDMAHTFTIIGREGWVVPTSYSPAQIDALAYGHSPPALENANVSGPGDVNVTTFDSPGPGWYEFVCTVSGHFQLGMYGFVAFGMNLPSNLTGANRTGLGGNLTFNAEDAVIVAVLVVACVAGYFYLNRRRQRERSQP
jgi:plastocyanin